MKFQRFAEVCIVTRFSFDFLFCRKNEEIDACVTDRMKNFEFEELTYFEFERNVTHVLNFLNYFTETLNLELEVKLFS